MNTDAARRPISLRLTEEEIALLPDSAATPAEAIRMLMAKGAETTSIDRLLERRLDALREGLEAWFGTQIRNPAAPASSPAHDALEMILRHLRDIHHCQLRIEAVATATLYGVADSEATGEDMEAQLQTRFDEHMACVWPHFLAENEHGLRSLRGADDARESAGPTGRLDAPAACEPDAANTADSARSGEGGGSSGGGD